MLAYGCKTKESVLLPPYEASAINAIDTTKKYVYHPSRTRLFDLINTKLDVAFDWEKSHLLGTAELTLTPYFYPQSQLELDAKGFDIHKVTLVSSGGNTPLTYEYDQTKINITLNRTYKYKDTLKVRIEYTAKPNELEAKGSKAISEAKGLYFINPLGKDSLKPQQIWTQGETESSSCWFPTIDAPNERCTGQISITVQEKYQSLSNGVLTLQELNGDGTRTDHWEMNLPHAPYLFMLTIGEYAIVNDTWKGLDVDYYVEHAYRDHAKAIFGATPEMLSFFSDILGVPYPWQKYSQVVVRDYVSGAMENTSAVIFGEFVQQTKRELIDKNHEDIVAHELFHHWFGDLVTCESWANLPLNESFATYGEVLWKEFKYGADHAAHGVKRDLESYIQEARQTQKELIRFNYEHREDMFDRHSYEKGSCVLHMLRKYVGDDAFFRALKIYLEENKYSAVEIHQLRMAFEKVTGQDLNWFFNQWFLSSGHPVLDISYNYDSIRHKQHIVIQQTQNLETTPMFKLPTTIDIYFNGTKETHEVTIENITTSLTYDLAQKPDLVNVDAEKMLLCEKNDNHSEQEWAFMYRHGNNFIDRYEAIQKLSTLNTELACQTMLSALKDPYHAIREQAVIGLDLAAQKYPEEVKQQLLELGSKDKNSIVRGNAINALSIFFRKDTTLFPTYHQGLEDSSYFVTSMSLQALFNGEERNIIRLAKKFESINNPNIITTVASIYATEGKGPELSYFLEKEPHLKGIDRYDFIQYYSDYMLAQDDKTVQEGLSLLHRLAMKETIWWIRLNGQMGLIDLKEKYKQEIEKAEKQATLDSHELASKKATKSKILSVLEEIKATEKNANLLQMLDQIE